MKLIVILMIGLFLAACSGYDDAKKNRLKYAAEIRETTKECLVSIRDSPKVQNFNDDNEIVKSCTEYAMKLYGANWND